MIVLIVLLRISFDRPEKVRRAREMISVFFGGYTMYY